MEMSRQSLRRGFTGTDDERELVWKVILVGGVCK